jgi:hypothetical protein
VEPGTVAAEFLHRAAGSRAAAELREGVRQGVHHDDVALCLEVDRFPFAVVAPVESSLMVLRPRPVPPPSDDARPGIRIAGEVTRPPGTASAHGGFRTDVQDAGGRGRRTEHQRLSPRCARRAIDAYGAAA